MEDDDRPDDAKRLETARLDRGFKTAKDAARFFGWSYETYIQHEQGRRGIGRAADKYAKAYKVSKAWLLTGEGGGQQFVPLVGRAGAGSAVALFALNGDDPAEEVPLPPGVAASPSLVAVEVEGTSLGALFDRSLVFYDDRRSPVSEDLLRKLCIVGLTDGRVLIKQILPGSKRGFYHLLSQTEGMIEDVAIDWAARVKSVVPR